MHIIQLTNAAKYCLNILLVSPFVRLYLTYRKVCQCYIT
nr:MAG TPA: hypothetical protein [Caudoviricetes sp.]